MDVRTHSHAAVGLVPMQAPPQPGYETMYAVVIKEAWPRDLSTSELCLIINSLGSSVTSQ